ncbi:MAG: GntR family transcriptional regulator [Clostridia bacterium]|nr:GntR family transcriptional regulator [Clostridia bacterium]
MIINGGPLSLEEKVYLELEEEILSGALERGAPLSEMALSARLGVSRTPIRSALRRLAEEGLISMSANRGATVVGITEEDLADIYKIRVRLEGLASASAAERISEGALATLRESVELAEFYIKRGNTEKLKELDSTFHETIYKESGNRLLCRTLSELHKKIKSYRKLSLSVPGRLERSAEEHRQILEAIERGESSLADSLTAKHIEAAFENLVSALDDRKRNGEN